MRKTAIKNLLAISVLATSISGGAIAQTKETPEQAAAKMAVQVCSNCHGPAGNSTSPVFPILAGQQMLYLEAQIKAFRSKTRSDPEAHDYMWGMATPLDDQLVSGLAEYYAKQTPVPGKVGNSALIAKGKGIYTDGDVAHGVLACAGCHGANAEGVAVFPRLAGQHGAYIIRQIQVILTQLRDAPVMHGVVRNLSEDQIKAVAEYLQSL